MGSIWNHMWSGSKLPAQSVEQSEKVPNFQVGPTTHHILNQPLIDSQLG